MHHLVEEGEVFGLKLARLTKHSGDGRIGVAGQEVFPNERGDSRYRTNVWEYRGVNKRKAGRLEELALHPTVKPVAMIADAIKDVSRRGGIVLDLFGGSGSTLIAAHKTGRRARVCELDPIYCDRILHRWEIFAKDEAELIACGLGTERTASDRARGP